MVRSKTCLVYQPSWVVSPPLKSANLSFSNNNAGHRFIVSSHTDHHPMRLARSRLILCLFRKLMDQINKLPNPRSSCRVPKSPKPAREIGRHFPLRGGMPLQDPVSSPTRRRVADRFQRQKGRNREAVVQLEKP